MKIIKFNSEEEWLSCRRGVIRGTRRKGILAKPKNGNYPITFYELIAERVAIPHGNESYLDRGKRLEEVAMERFQKETGKKINTDLVLWHRDDDENIAVSPDGSIGKTEAVEVKCLSSTRHIEAWLTQKIPSDFECQAIQYFIVNEKLKKLYLVFFDPNMPKDLFWLEVQRKDVQDKVDEYLELEKETLKKIAEIEKSLTF